MAFTYMTNEQMMEMMLQQQEQLKEQLRTTALQKLRNQDYNGLADLGLQYKNAFSGEFDGTQNMSNSSSTSTTKPESSDAPKLVTLTATGQLKPSTITLETKKTPSKSTKVKVQKYLDDWDHFA